MGLELHQESQVKLRQIRECFGDLVEDEREFTTEFEHSIQRSERHIAGGKPIRVSEPQGS